MKLPLHYYGSVESSRPYLIIYYNIHINFFFHYLRPSLILVSGSAATVRRNTSNVEYAVFAVIILLLKSNEKYQSVRRACSCARRDRRPSNPLEIHNDIIIRNQSLGINIELLYCDGRLVRVNNCAIHPKT